MRASVLIFAILSMAILGGCKKYFIYNHFITYGERGDFYTSTCEMRSAGYYPIGEEKLYQLKTRDGVRASIYIIRKGNFMAIKVLDGVGGILPIESCGDEWCKIYYPCGERGYFVKKDEIEKWQWQ